MPKVIVAPGRIQVLEPVSPYDDFVRAFLATMHDVRGVLISGYPAILLGRSRQTEDIDMFLWPMQRAAFVAWYGRLEKAGFWCLNAGVDGAWDLLEHGQAPRFAKSGNIEPNVEVKIPTERRAREQMDRAWQLDLLGQQGWIGDLSDQVAYKVFMGTAHERHAKRLPTNKDIEDAAHIARAAHAAIDWDEAHRLASILGVSETLWEQFRERS